MIRLQSVNLKLELIFAGRSPVLCNVLCVQTPDRHDACYTSLRACLLASVLIVLLHWYTEYSQKCLSLWLLRATYTLRCRTCAFSLSRETRNHARDFSAHNQLKKKNSTEQGTHTPDNLMGSTVPHSLQTEVHIRGSTVSEVQHLVQLDLYRVQGSV